MGAIILIIEILITLFISCCLGLFINSNLKSYPHFFLTSGLVFAAMIALITTISVLITDSLLFYNSIFYGVLVLSAIFAFLYKQKI